MPVCLLPHLGKTHDTKHWVGGLRLETQTMVATFEGSGGTVNGL